MKTKHFILTVALCGPAFILPTLAQGLYLGIGGGYGFGAAGSFGQDSKTVISGTSSTTEYNSRSLSLGKGVNIGLYAGYMFNKNIGAELGLAYLLGGKTVFTYESTNGSSNNHTYSEDTYSGSMMRIVPTIRIAAGDKKLKPYMKCGLIIGIAGKMYSESHSETTNPSSTKIDESTEEYSGGIGMGFHGGVGINFMITDKLGIFGEVVGNYHNWAAKKSILTKSTDDGVDELPNMKVYDKETEYLDTYTTDNSVPTNRDVPRRSTKFAMPFSSIGISIGVHITLGGGDSQ